MSENISPEIAEIDILIAWNQRTLGLKSLSNEDAEKLTSGTRAAFEKIENDFLDRMENGDFDGDEPEIEDQNDEVSSEKSPLQSVGLDRATSHDETTQSILDQRRAELLNKNGKSPTTSNDAEKNDEILDPEKVALQVISDLGINELPIDPIKIADEEGIEHLGDAYGVDFDARIEYHPEIQKFAIFYQLSRPGFTIGRVNFSLAHELGHYYLHSRYLLSGKSHNSQSDYRSKDPMEREADAFAAALLMPRHLFKSRIEKLRREICTLRDICKLAKDQFKTSITSTTLRYLKCDFEPCAMVMSRDNQVLWADYSTDMQYLGMKYIPFGSRVPAKSRSFALRHDSPDDIVDGEIDSQVWFEYPKRSQLWEEAMTLGHTGLVLTFLTLLDPEME